MKYFTSLIQVLQLLGARRAVLLVLALFLNSLLEAFGIATLVPLLVLALGQQEQAPPLAQYIFDILRNIGLPVEVWLLAVLAAGALVLREIFSFLILSWAGFLMSEVEAEKRREALAEVMQARWPWYNEHQLGDIAISLAQFPTYAVGAVETTVKALAVLLRAIIYMVLIVAISPVLAMLVLIISAMLFGPLSLLLRFTRRFSSRYAGATVETSAHLADVLASIKMFKAMGLEQKVQPLFARLINRMRKFRKRLVMTTNALTALQNIVGIIMIFSALFAAINWVGVSVVEISVVAGLVLSVVRNITKSQTLLQKTSIYVPYLRKVEALASSAHSAREMHAGRKQPYLQEGITLQQISFSYPDRVVLSGIQATFPARRINVIMGPSGAGKTTIIDLITGLQQPQEGAILIDGVPLTELDLKAWRDMIGYVPQELILLSGTVRENIQLGQQVSDEDIWRALRLAGAEEFIRELPEGLDTDLGERGVKLSGGQRQRLSLARALVRRPKLLILDEVTSALDPQTERKLVESVADLARQEGITVIAITHTPAWRKVADVLVRLENGKAESCQPKVEGSCPENT